MRFDSGDSAKLAPMDHTTYDEFVNERYEQMEKDMELDELEKPIRLIPGMELVPEAEAEEHAERVNDEEDEAEDNEAYMKMMQIIREDTFPERHTKPKTVFDFDRVSQDLP